MIMIIVFIMDDCGRLRSTFEFQMIPPCLDRERDPDERTSGSFTDSYEENMEVIPYHR